MQRFTVRILPDVQSTLRHLPPMLKMQIRQALEELGSDPYVGKPLQRQLKGLYSYRVSRYRIVYRIRRQEILVEVIDIAARSLVYARVAEWLTKVRR